MTVVGCRAIQVNFHHACGSRGIPCRNRLDDPFVLVERDFLSARPVQERGVIVEDPLQHRLGHGCDDRVAGDRCKLAVEGDVAANEIVRIAEFLALLREEPAQVIEILLIALVGRDLDEPYLEQFSSLLEVIEIFRCGRNQELGDSIDLGERRGRADLIHSAALSMRYGDQANCMHRLQGFPDCGSSDAEARHEIALGRYRVTWLELAVQDHVAEPVEDLIGKFTPDNSVTGDLGRVHHESVSPLSLKVASSEMLAANIARDWYNEIIYAA